MKSDEYMAVLADLDRKIQSAGTTKRKKELETARRHLTAVCESERPKTRPRKKVSAIQPPTRDMKKFLEAVRKNCMMATVDQKAL